MVEWAGPLPRIKSFFVPKNDKFGYFLTQFLTDRKHGQSLGTRIIRFNRETKFTKTVQNYQKTHGQTKPGGERSHMPLNTPLLFDVFIQYAFTTCRTRPPLGGLCI